MTVNKTHILYVPGLGDNYDPFRRLCLRAWRLFGVTTELVPMVWYDGESFESKHDTLQQKINQAASPTKRLVIVGESAGASMALIASSRNETVTRVITLCGVTQADTPIAASLRRRAPALDQAVHQLKDLTPRTTLSIVSVRAKIDHVIKKRYSIAPNATEHIVWWVGHITTITLCLTFLAPFMCRLAKQH